MIELGIVESVNNAIEHAYGGRSGGEVEVRMTINAREVSADVIDRGSPMSVPPLERKAPELDPADRESLPEGGFGLSIIRSVFDEVTSVSEGNVNRLTLRKLRTRGK